MVLTCVTFFCIFDNTMDKFKVIIVEDVPLEMKGTEGLLSTEVPEAEVIGKAQNEGEYLRLLRNEQPDLVLLDLGLQGNTTIGVELCRNTKAQYKNVKILVFTGEILNEKLWVDALDAGADGIILKMGEMLTRVDIMNVMNGKKYVFNEPILEVIIDKFKKNVSSDIIQQEASVGSVSRL